MLVEQAATDQATLDGLVALVGNQQTDDIGLNTAAIVATYDSPPEGFKSERDVPHGKLEMIEYESNTVGTTLCSICCTASVATKQSGNGLHRRI